MPGASPMLKRVRKDGLDFFEAEGLPREHGIRVVFTDRRGGASSGPYSSLNLSFNVGDLRDAVRANRSLVASAMGIPGENWVMCQQVHGTRVKTVRRLDMGRGSRDFNSAVPRCDGMVCNEPGMAAGVLTADCAPIAMVSPAARSVAIVHAGWKGALGRIARFAVRRLCELANSDPSEILVFIGPHIGECCMEVGEDVALSYQERFPGAVRKVDGEKPRIDIEKACALQLESWGVPGQNVFSTGVCTMCSPDYFSHRGSGGSTGRQAGLVAIL